MTVLVTGGAGYIGSHMVWRLLDAGEDVVVVDRLSTGFRWAVPSAARFYLGDAADETLLQTIFAENDIDAIIHFAGSSVVPASIEDPLGYYENNTGKTRTLMSAAIRAGIRHFVFSSTAAVYGSQPADRPVKESAPLLPETPYGQSKLMSELMLRDAATAYDFRYVALRYFNVAGADPQGRAGQSTDGATHLVKVACEAALGRRRQVEIYGTDYPTHDGTGVRDYIHVSDLVDAHLMALRHLRDGGRPLVANCGYGVGYSVLDVLNMVMRVHGRAFRIHMAPRRPGDTASVVADATLAHRELGWTPKYNCMETIVRSSLEWELQLADRSGFDASGLRKVFAAPSL
ncbi:UDP-glucose 4-epimerase GalE [Agrobacterium sp. SHOUNA12C]|uniref:UDP-glucose 4-epimerase n=1 Tax=Rhizobium rhizogenes (strain K84 / ATCC BAA-868) TaxID=311403 RepID=B9J926_RHIR8|nr:MULTISPECIES: UDP-glucose 4-epimerase GalE [Rhizobium]ACM25428.1 UDP-glucose 4-epimerase [Rhizobium rhizogenes K84]KAA6486840.1 UDP-glucose 4-epimerase GalE [Agrobacterium sp. ICMP 7243]MCJ9722451.1 UDP-glucose 4-epimerase GalE [Agrobacterium sp. BETTINA12B]MCJ9757516.1 UDP-glucose 4-epimerase GalE [Agrobacterium sp. SHOUNA12C]OCI98046.1 UDP-glucose 4-epimerase GalE [Agrobacterium sp. 13-626]OCJ21771.1 UDP-glucose 4-epimerase GalE [Agrobacterium sp. B131/95]OCJ26785.1 UDP-glucose 4-epimer